MRRPPWLAIAALLLSLLPLAAHFELLLRAAVDIPNLDDYDTVLGFFEALRREDSALGKLRLLFAPHIEHRPALLRACALATRAVLGRVDFAVLCVLGHLGLVALLLGLFAAFRRGEPLRARLPAFAPAAFLLVQPQYWDLFLWSTGSVSNLWVLAFALLACLAVHSASRAAPWLALALSALAVFSQGNGFLVLPVAVLLAHLTPAARGRWPFTAGALVLLAGYLALYPRGPDSGGALMDALAHPLRLVAYALNFIGSAAAFSLPGLSLAAGVALLASFAALAAGGLARQSPACFGLLLFLFASVAANALARAAQGAATPLLQPRYQLFASALLAASYLAWAERLRGGRLARGFGAAALALAIGFCALSHGLHRRHVFALAERLEQGLDHWWATGRGGLSYPRFAKANALLQASLESGVYALPREIADRHAARTRRPAILP